MDQQPTPPEAKEQERCRQRQNRPCFTNNFARNQMHPLWEYGQCRLDYDPPLMDPNDALRLLGLHRSCNRVLATTINNFINCAIEEARSGGKDVYPVPVADQAQGEFVGLSEWFLDEPGGRLQNYRTDCIQAFRALVVYVIRGGSFASLNLDGELGVVGDNPVQPLGSLHGDSAIGGATGGIGGGSVGDATAQTAIDIGLARDAPVNPHTPTPSSRSTIRARRDPHTGNLTTHSDPHSLHDVLAEQFERTLNITTALDQLVPPHLCLHGRRNAISVHGGIVFPLTTTCLGCGSYSCCCCCAPSGY